MTVAVRSQQRALDVPAHFGPAVRAVEALAAEDRYLGALVFGSVADGTATTESDLDIRVVVDGDNPCPNINHPRIGGVKLDITFHSQRQLARQTEQETREGRRAPMIAGALILFDKTGALADLSLDPPIGRWGERISGLCAGGRGVAVITTSGERAERRRWGLGPVIGSWGGVVGQQ